MIYDGKKKMRMPGCKRLEIIADTPIFCASLIRILSIVS